MNIINLKKATAPLEESLPAAEKIISGNPVQRTENYYSGAKENFFVGHWESEPGKWTIDCTGDEEYCHLLKGKVCLTDAEGNCQTFKAGDEFIIPEGFKGTWETIEPCRKLYVIASIG